MANTKTGPKSRKHDEESSPLELLNYLIEENGITTRELGKILRVDHSVAARIAENLAGNYVNLASDTAEPTIIC